MRSEGRGASDDGPAEAIAITGASRGLGAALARAYAGDGTHLALAARSNRALLDVVGGDCARRGASVSLACFDVADTAAAKAWIDGIERRHALGTLIVNAGMFSGNGADGRLESLSGALEQLRTNLAGAVTVVDAALPAMRRRRRGRIVLVSSLAALHPLADAPAYSASKAGLAAYGEAMRELLAPEGVSVSIVFPGNIKTSQTDRHVGQLPLLMSPERAAAIIKKRVERGQSHIAFPRRLHGLILAGRLLPWRWRAMTGRSLRFHVADDPR
ncbi:MAG: SDR family NAD(P)-dependent oxidoreductase [Hyphomicrobium sp.]